MKRFWSVSAGKLSMLAAVLLVAACEQGGELKSGFAPPDNTALDPQTISVVSSTDTINTGVGVQLQVVGYNAAGDSVPVNVDWNASGGTVSSTGRFSATSPGTYTVSATDRPARRGRPERTPPLSGNVEIVAVSGPVILTQVILSPAAVSITTGSTQQFQAASVFSDGSTAASSGVEFSATGGTITGNGLYTAGTTTGLFSVIARDSASGLADTSSVGIGVPVPTLTSIVLSPASATLDVAEQITFRATGNMSDGSSTTVNVTYSATGGTVTAAGRYTAGTTPGTYSVFATHQSGLADTAGVVIQSPPTLQAIVVTPSSASVAAGATRQFSASGTMSDGSTTPVSVTWTATGGSINGSGLYTAGSTQGSYQVIATHGSGLSDAATVTVTPPPPPPPPPPSGVDSAVALLVGPMLTTAEAASRGGVVAQNDQLFLQWAPYHRNNSWGWINDNFYDRAFNHYAYWLRSGDAQYKTWADSYALAYQQNAGTNQAPRNASLEGMAVYYLLNGQPAAWRTQIVGLAQSLSIFTPANMGTPGYRWAEGRILARAGLGALVAYLLGDTSRDWGALADEYAQVALTTQNADGSYTWQIQDGQDPRVDGDSNFMHGLVGNFLTKWVRIRRGGNFSPQVTTWFHRSADYFATQWVPADGGFLYWNVGGGTSGNPDGNQLITLTLAVAHHTGHPTAGSQADASYAGGVNGSYYQGFKQFNQQYYDSHNYPYYRQ